jgi:hypothetical protein
VFFCLWFHPLARFPPIGCIAFEEIRHEIWIDPLTGEFIRPSSVGQLLGKPRWEKRLLKFLGRPRIGRIGPDHIEDEIRRIISYEGWENLVPDDELVNGEEEMADQILDIIVVHRA